MIFNFERFQIDIDVEKTSAFYIDTDVVSAGCSCDGCRNYESAVDVLPDKVISFFNELGVDMKKACEVYVNCTNPDGTLFYGGFYHLCGVLVNGESAWISTGDIPSISHWESDKAFYITESFSVSCHNGCDLLEDGFPLPALQLEISANIPWVLPGNNPYITDIPSSDEKKKGFFGLFNK